MFRKDSCQQRWWHPDILDAPLVWPDELQSPDRKPSRHVKASSWEGPFVSVLEVSFRFSMLAFKKWFLSLIFGGFVARI